MLGMEARNTRMERLTVGDAVMSIDTPEGWVYPESAILEIKPTTDEWVPDNMVYVFANGEYDLSPWCAAIAILDNNRRA